MHWFCISPTLSFIWNISSLHGFLCVIFLCLAANLESVSVLLLSLHIEDRRRNRPPLLLRGNPRGLDFFLQCMLFLLASSLFSPHLSPPSNSVSESRYVTTIWWKMQIGGYKYHCNEAVSGFIIKLSNMLDGKTIKHWAEPSKPADQKKKKAEFYNS